MAKVLNVNLPTLSRKCVAVGRNYAAHALELSNAPPTLPFWFFKPSTSYMPASLSARATLPLPSPTSGAHPIHHEVELAAIIGRRCSKLRSDEVIYGPGGHVRGFAVGVDVTARGWQDLAKKAGLPWARAKGADGFLPIGGAVIAPEEGIREGRLWLKVNGVTRQEACVSEMAWVLAELIEDISSAVTLEEWDVVLTGTPAGVSSLEVGDVVTAGFGDVKDMELEFCCT